MNVKNIAVKNILYTTDLSDTALHAFSYAASLANAYKARLIILHVMEDYDVIEPNLAGILMEDQWQKIKESHIREARETLSGKNRGNVIVQEALTRFSENVRADQETPSAPEDEVLVLFGDPVEKILEISKEKSADLIVMGTHGHGLLQDLLGSTARKVIKRSSVPVLTIPIGR